MYSLVFADVKHYAEYVDWVGVGVKTVIVLEEGYT